METKTYGKMFPPLSRNKRQFCLNRKNGLLCLKQQWQSTKDSLETKRKTQKLKTNIKKMDTFPQVFPKDQRKARSGIQSILGQPGLHKTLPVLGRLSIAVIKHEPKPTWREMSLLYLKILEVTFHY